MEKFDITVIGAGPGGYVAAIRAAQNGAKVALVEKEFLGGTCLNWGCIPTKTLLASAEVLHMVQAAASFGIQTTGSAVADFAAMQKRKDDVVAKLRNGIAQLVKANKITLFTGAAAFQSRRQIAITADGKTEVIESDKVIIASGSAPLVPGFIPKSERVLDSTAMLAAKTIPASLLVLGGGVIGCEFACLFARLGTKVTVVEMLDSILPTLDKEVARTMAAEMKKLGIEIHTGKPLADITATGTGISGNVGDTIVMADYLLVSIGRKPISAELNLAAAGVKADAKGFIAVDDHCRTSVPGVYAIGDVTGRVQLAHVASAMGICAANNATGKDDTFRDDLVPGCIFTFPEIGTVGLTAEQCAEKNLETHVGKFPFAALGKAMAIGETAGFCKIIADKHTDRVLGVHIIGAHATDLIAEAATAMNLQVTAAELGKAIHAHPTLGEITMEAAHAVHGNCIHAPPKKK